MQEELKLTEDQIKKVQEFSTKVRAEFPRPQPGEQPDREKMQEAMKKVQEMTATFNKETLTPDQAKRYKEIQLQVNGVLGAFNNEETAKALKVTDEQKEKVKEIGAAMMKDMQEMRQAGGFDAAKATALRKEAGDKAMEVLTSEQKKTWEEMTGKPFDYKPDQGGFGGGKGGKKKPNPDKDK